MKNITCQQSTVDVAIVIVTYNSASVITRLLDSLPAAAGDVRSSVVVVDNGSVDDTASIVNERDDCAIVRSENRGYAAGVNLGVAHSPPSTSILVLNADVELQAGCILRLVSVLTMPATGVVVPRLLNADGTAAWSLRNDPGLVNTLGLSFLGDPRLSEYVRDPARYRCECTADWAVGAVMLLSSECYRTVGGMDESFFLYSEETDFCMRARDAGYVIRFTPHAVATHIGGQSGRNPRTHSMQIVNQVRLFRRRRRLFPSIGYYLLVIAREVRWWRRQPAESRAAIAALLRPSRRPIELNCGSHLIPR